jgi:hypothetical protein
MLPATGSGNSWRSAAASRSTTRRSAIRESIADAKTSLVSKPKEIEGDAQTSLLVSDDRLGGKKAFVVLIDASGNVVTKLPTVIGE